MARRQQRPGTNRPAEWQFFTFPVAFALAVGLLLGPLLYFLTYGFFVWVALFCVSFGLAHIAGHGWRRIRMTKQALREEEEERERHALAARAAAQQESGERPTVVRRRRRRK
jgi:heme exporter protein D